ncbi:MAG: InlB B-repeat-containing protein, partial [Opitutaceae bacterium]|nr:InlB B-repeat-containing protein [Opitutaceae bacterium]
GVGNVFRLCEDRETGRATGATGSYATSGSSSDNHMHFSHSNLWDQCRAHNSWWSADHRGTNGTVYHGLAAAKSVYWNTSGSGTRGGAVVTSQQGRYGYIIGTSGTRSSVSTSTTGNTAPADIVEGVGQGASLQPQSLYADQLARRLQPAVTYTVNSATSGVAPVDALNPYASGATVTVLGPGTLARTGFTFSGWNTAQNGTGTSYAPGATFPITGPVLLHAQWTPQSYTVSFDAQGGAPVASISVAFGSAYGVLPVPSRAGNSFTGWFTAPTGGELVTASSLLRVPADQTLYARWTSAPQVDAGADQYTVFDTSVPWTPAKIATAAWFDAADISTLTPASGTVSEWRDKSTNANHLAQATAARRPVTGTRTIGNLNAVAFNADLDHFMDAVHSASLSFEASGGFSSFTVLRSPGYNDQTGTFNAVFGKGSPFSTTPGYGLNFNPSFNFTFKFSDGGTRALTLGSAYFDTPLLFSTTGNYATGAQAFFLQGGALSITNTATPTPRTSDNIGDFRVGGAAPMYTGSGSWGTTTRYATMDLAELILVPGALSTADRQRIEGYLAHKWSLASTLPTTHPHRASAPTQLVYVATLSGAATAPAGKVLTHAWSFVSGPAPVTFANPASLQTTALFPVTGVYTLRLTSSDGLGSGFDELVIYAGIAPPPPPASPFVAWFGGITEQQAPAAFVADANADGVPDGLAWLLGAPAAPAFARPLLPAPVFATDALVFDFTLLPPAARGVAVVKIEYSADLVAWTAVPVPESSGQLDEVAFEITPVDGLLDVRATLPRELFGDGPRAFVRLRAEWPAP